jgi:hypothetical protein
VTTYAVHPGRVATEALRHTDESMFRGARWLFGVLSHMSKTAEQGAQTTIYCAVDEKVAAQSGLYYR